MIEKVKKETTLPIVKSAHVLMRADARKGVASLRKMPLFHAPAPESPTATSPDDNESRKGKESPYGYSDIVLLKKNAPQT